MILKAITTEITEITEITETNLRKILKQKQGLWVSSRLSRCPQVSASERVVRWFQKTLTGK